MRIAFKAFLIFIVVPILWIASSEVIQRPVFQYIPFLSMTYRIDSTNVRIKYWRDYYAKDSSRVSDARRNFYYPVVKQAFLDAGYTWELADIFAEIPSIESNWHPFANSDSGAMGLWQFTYPTGDRFGLHGAEFYDPFLATNAAISYITEMLETFNGDPVKVLFAYNGGPGTVLAMMRKQKVSDPWKLKFRANETKDFAPKVLGAMLYFKEREFNVVRD